MKLSSVLRAAGVTVAAALTLTACGGASADDAAWPDSNIEMLIGFGAGGTPDLIGRGAGEHLQREYGINVTASNCTGRASTIELNDVMSAEEQGTTPALENSNDMFWQYMSGEGTY